MHIESVTAHGFGPLSNQTLGLAPGRVATERDGHDSDMAAYGSGPQTRRATPELAL